ncbi:transposase/IS protein [Geobacillus sp. BCO2]|nr:transposase/IS protein [Geobacillus sp. BCO2]
MKERIHEYCHRLHLPVMAERWSAMAEYASTHNIPYSEFLFRLLEAEIVEKQERSIQTLIKLSKLPYCKTIDTFDFTAQLQWMSAGFESCLRCLLLTEKRISFFSVHRGLERRIWRFRLEWRRSQKDIKRILLPPMIWSLS